MADINIGSVSGGQNQFGENNTQHNHGVPAAEAVRLAGDLVRQLQAEQRPHLVGQAQMLQGELVDAQQHGRSVDQGRVRGWLDAITAGAGAGSAALSLAQALGGAIGL
ncbi:hypothetical protein AB0M39_24875 [Streptomyces sp. NPDC051907]|uniref:hypothetical protein n=1 Tax=Streptomyces sp. NPDC051907 TaxID=3155284 RepID=UPI003416B471